jgi:phosphopantothenoylcysteine decarboxylase / phosphopantothenate---cysteine ligase
MTNHFITKPHVLIGVGGGIAVYKVCEVVSKLFQMGMEIRVILTHSAQEFIKPLTLATLSRHQAYTDQDFWQSHHARPLHIELGEWADLMVIAPLTANTLAKLTYGLADNLLTNTVLASTCPILLAPAMNTDMWEQETVKANWYKLQEFKRYYSLSPTGGLLACDRVGIGRMAEAPEIMLAVQSLLYTRGKQDLKGKHLLITTGGTKEYLDPVRFIGNPATGKMGVALAQAALHRGASVTLIHTHVDLSSLNSLANLNTIAVTSAQEMETAVFEHLSQAHWIIMAAAIADFKPAHYTPYKLPKAEMTEHLLLAPVTDIAAKISQVKKPEQILIGFAAQTGDIVTPALDKLKRKNLDVIVANPVDQAHAGFGSDTNQAMIINAQGQQKAIPSCSKLALSHQIFDFINY